MSTRRGGKKKAPAQQKHQTISSSSPFEAPEDDVPRPAVPQTTPASPAVVMQQLASKAITPVVTAAKAISTAVRAMPAIAEGPAISTAQLDNDQPSSPGPSAGIQQPAFAMTAQKLFADSHAQQDQGNGSKATAAVVNESPRGQQVHAVPSTRDLDADMQLPEALSASMQLRSKLQQLCSSFGGRKGTLLLCAVVLVPVLIAVVMQGQVLKSQAHALQAQQQLVAAQAQALQDLRTELQATSAQLPNLLHTAHATNSSLSTLTAEQTALLNNLEGLAALTQRLQQDLGSMNDSQQAGEHAWELLKGVAALNCSGQQDESACINQSAASVESATAALKAIMQQSLQAAAQQKGLQEREQLAQQQLLQHQQELLQALPKTIQQVVQQQMSAQAPLPDVALADCGARITFTTPVAASILPKLGFSAGQHSQHSSTGITWASMASVLQQLQASFRPKQQPAGPASTAPDVMRSALGPAAGSSIGGMDPHQEQQLLHRVLLRPASGWLPVSCIPFALAIGSPAVVEIQLPQPAHIHNVALQVPQVPDATAPAGASGGPVLAPGQVSVALLNSSSCGGQAVTCTHLLHAASDPAEHAADDVSTTAADAQLSGVQSSSPASASFVRQPSDVLKAGTTAAMYTHGLVEGVHKGRVVVPVSAGGSKSVKGAEGHSASAVLADRVVVIVTGTEGALDVCMGRISVYGRPVDLAGFC